MTQDTKYTKDLIPALSTQQNISTTETAKAVQFILNYITNALNNKLDLNITNFGKFKAQKRHAKHTTHPLTHKRYTIPERIIYTCKFSKNWDSNHEN